MLTIKRLISALFIMFFVSYTNVALAVTCSKGTWPTIDSCVQCEKGRFCVGGTCTPSTTGTQTVCEEGKGPSGIGIGVAECANVLPNSTSDAGAKSADNCYRTMNGREYITKKNTQYVPGYYFYEVSDCPSGTTSVCASGTVVSYADIKNSDTYCECVAPDQIVNLRWYDGFGGELPTTSFVNAVNNGYPSTGVVNSALTLPASPYVTQDGLFNGWEYDGGQIYNGEIPADSFTETGDVYMYANYSDDAMAVDFSNPAATGTLPSLSPDVEYSAADDNTVRLILEKGNCAPVYFDAEEMIDPDTPELIFVGWGIKNFSFRTYAQGLLYFFDGTPGYYCADGNKYGQRILNMEPVYYYPQFVIRYGKNADGATGTMSDIYCSAGDPGCLLSENKFEYTGYTFSGWDAKLTRRVLPLYAGENDTISGSGANKFVLREQDLGVLSAGADVVEYANQITEIPFSSTLASGSMLTLTAQWTPNTYTITFNPGTGDGVSAENVDFDSALPETIVPPSRLGYSFGGYYNGSEQYYDATGARQVEKYTTASDLELTAQWTPNTYTITFSPENGGAATTETATFDAQYPTAPSVAKTGYTFVGWFDSVTGGTQYYTDDGATYAVADDLTLYAQWTPNTYTITFNPENGGATTTETATFDAQYPTAPSVAKTGYTFVGWFDSVTGGTQYYTDDGATYTVADDLKLYAQWTPNSFTITYNGNGATGEMSPTTCTYDQSCFVADNAFTKTGYKFAGWQMTDGTPVAVGADFTNKTAVANDNIILVAQWEQATIACQPGKYYDGANFITCPAGVYCPYDANTSVTVGVPGCFVDCPAGYDDATNITSKFECAMNIEPGYYILNAYDSKSSICPKGYSCPGNTMIRYGNKGDIYSCSGATYSDTQGSASCASCPSVTNVFNASSAGNAPNDYDEYNDDMTDCYALYHFVEKWYTDAFYGGGDSAYNPDLELNQRGDFAVKCRYNKNTQSYESDCYGSYVNYCAAGYYSPQAQHATSYEDARNKIYENVDLSNPDTWPCQPVGEDYGFVSADINGQYINNLTDEEKLATLQRQCLPITNDAGAATYSVSTSSELFELSAPTCIVNYGFMPMYAFTETYKPGSNLRGYYLVSCLYNKDTKNYEGNCKATVSYCESGYYTTMTPYTGDEYTDNMIYHSNSVQDAVAAVCIPVGYGYYSPGQMQCMLEQGINPEEVTYGNIPEIDTNALDMCLAKFVDINDIVSIQKAFSSRTQCPDGGLTDTDTAGDIVECYLESVDCVNADGNAGVKRCYYNKETKTYDANCGECQITSCVAGQYMTAQGCAPCPANSTSVAGSVSCTCDTGYNADGNTTTTGALCEPNAYTVTYISGDSLNITRTETATYNTEYTISNVAFEKTGYVQTGWKNVDLHQSIYTLGQKITYNFDYNITLSPIYTCAAGYYGDGITCTICPVGSYCPVGATEPTICPENSTSEAGDTECVCKAGYSIEGDTTTDAACEPNIYTVTYMVGQVHPFNKVTFGTEYTTNPTPYPQTGRTQTGWSVMMPTYLGDKVFGLGETFTYNVPSNMDLGPKYRQNQFKLNFQDGGAYNAGEYTLPTDVVAEYDRPLPDILGFGTIELQLLEPETTAGQRHLVSDGWSFDQKNKAWNNDGTNPGNYPNWNTYYDLPIEDGTTVNVYPLWKTFELKCNAGYYIPSGSVGNKSCTVCRTGYACPGFDELRPVGGQYGMFVCPQNSTSASTQGYCTCNEGFNTTGRPGGSDKIYPTIENGFKGQSCQQIMLHYTYHANGGSGDFDGYQDSWRYGYDSAEPMPINLTIYYGTLYREGRVLVGWGETPDATTPYDYKGKIMTQDKDLYAIWKPCESGTYKDADAAGYVQCTTCPESHQNTDGIASTGIDKCYAECEAQIDVVGGIAFSDNDKAYYDNVCTYSRGIDQEGNGCSVINGACVQTDCAPDYEMVNGACVPCARKNALTYSDNGNCRIETCVYGFHPNGDQCEKNVIECIVPNAVSAERVWNDVSGSYSLCTITQCTDGFHIDANACISNVRTCKIENGIGDQVWDEKRNRWGDCVATKCEPGYTNNPSLTNENWKLCGRCNNMFGVNGERAASSYVAECEIASCMHQGEKYILENNECRLVCDSYADETGRRYWGNGKCIHDCNSGYLPW